MINKIRNNQTISGYFYAVLATAIWSGNFIVARGLSESIPPISLAFWRWVVAVMVFLPFALKYVIEEKKTLKKHLPYLLLTALLGITIFNTLIYVAGHTTTAINLSLISITFPVFIVVLSRVFFYEIITINKWVGIIFVITGIVLLVTKGDLSKISTISFAIGDLWMLLAAFTFAIYSILLKRKPEHLSIWSLQLSTFMLGLLFLFPFFIYEYLSSPTILWEPKTVFSILYVGIFASLTAFVLWNQAIIKIGPSKSGMIYYTLPLFSGLLAFFFLAESINSAHIISALLIISGILTANYEIRKV